MLDERSVKVNEKTSGKLLATEVAASKLDTFICTNSTNQEKSIAVNKLHTRQNRVINKVEGGVFRKRETIIQA